MTDKLEPKYSPLITKTISDEKRNTVVDQIMGEDWRNFKDGINALRSNNTPKAMITFVNFGIDEVPEGAMIATGVIIAGLSDAGYLRKGRGYDTQLLERLNLHRVNNFDLSELTTIMKKVDMTGIKGTLNENQAGLIDVSQEGKVLLGTISFSENKITWAEINNL